MSVILICEDCDRQAELSDREYKDYKKPITCKECKNEMVLQEDKEEEAALDEDEQDSDEEYDEVICPYCEKKISSFKSNSLGSDDGEAIIASCPKCNKLLGVLSY